MQNKEKNNKKPQQPKGPKDSGVVHVEGHIKIFDPNTKEVFINKRDS